MGEAEVLVENYKVNTVIFNTGKYNYLEKALIKTLKEKNINYYKDADSLNLKNNELYFLNTKIYDNENDNSNVIYLNYNNFQFLFMGDAGIEKERDILETYNLNNIDFIKIGHHGSNTSSGKNFIKTINPKTCLISVGKDNKFGHPKESVLKTLNDYCQIYRTDQDGSIMLKIKNNKLKIETCSP